MKTLLTLTLLLLPTLSMAKTAFYIWRRQKARQRFANTIISAPPTFAKSVNGIPVPLTCSSTVRRQSRCNKPQERPLAARL